MFMFTVMISTPLPPLTNRSHRGGDQSGSLPSRGYVKLLNQHRMLKIVRISKIRVMRTPADYLDKVLLGVQPAQTARENKQWARKTEAMGATASHLCPLCSLRWCACTPAADVGVKRQWETEKFGHFFRPCGTGQTGHWTHTLKTSTCKNEGDRRTLR